MNLITDPGFELGTSDWTWANGAERRGDAKHAGAYGAFVGWRTGQVPFPALLTQTGIPLTIGQTYPVTAWCASSGANHNYLECLIDAGDGAWVQQGYRSGDMSGYVHWNLGTFTALGTSGGIRFRCGNTSYNLQGWRVDDVVLDDRDASMAVKLAERAIGAVVSILQSNLSTELTAIDTDRADGITMAAPPINNYYKRPKPHMLGGTVHVEVFESSFDFFNPYTDSDAQRACYAIPLTVRFTWMNRDGDDAAEMTTRLRRYAAGAFNVINKNRTLGGTDDAIKIAVCTGVSAPWDTLGETGSVIKQQVTLGVEVKCEELQA